ncbi:spore germination protein [Tumebacillus flagellatus]|uniref:Spore gernimation protein n=1 Tax=Tumebacillus flagellatus TaxID=1157490 RepID=A0A074LV46_9BACL|nr:spore germination protein [Tumebacillus flagellatus]KEO83833.1 spore gernimation protein [Tumebacillus flagellatus]
MGIRKWLRSNSKKKNAQTDRMPPPRDEKEISSRLSESMTDLQTMFRDIPDLIVRPFTVKATGAQAVLAFFDGLTDRNAINNNVLQALMHEETVETEIPRIVTVGQVNTASSWSKVESSLFSGLSLLLVDGQAEAYLFDTRGWPQRAIEDPQLEASLKSSHQGFIETGSQNIALVRRYIDNREMKIKVHRIGARGTTQVSILYLADVAKPEVLRELEDRLQKINVDSILNSGELVELIEDNPYSPFPQFITSERPDTVASQILQGRLAVVVDRSPAVIICPVSFASFFQNVDDYSIKWQIASFLRILRFMAFFVTIFLPSTYIGVTSFQYEVIPLQLLLSVGESRGNVPFPPLLEALIMELTLEMLKEAGVRLPAPIGQTVGIVGAIVIGQATVQAGIVSNIMVIVVSLTALASFIIPNYDMSSAIRLIRFPMMIMAALFGLVGVGVGMMVLIGHLVALESLGVPYFASISPLRFADWKDTIIRLPLWKMDKRPLSARPVQETRQGPSHPEGDG